VEVLEDHVPEVLKARPNGKRKLNLNQTFALFLAFYSLSLAFAVWLAPPLSSWPNTVLYIAFFVVFVVFVVNYVSDALSETSDADNTERANRLFTRFATCVRSTRRKSLSFRPVFARRNP
jgi:membrane protein implicated in regulation of membrane protease activity